MDNKKRKTIIFIAALIVVLVAVAVSVPFIVDAVRADDGETVYNDRPVSEITTVASSVSETHGSTEANSSSTSQKPTESTSESSTNKPTEKTTEDSARYIELKVVLPQGKSVKATLYIIVDGFVVVKEEMRVEGQTYTYKSKEMFEGPLVVEAKLDAYKTSAKVNFSAKDTTKKIDLPLNETEDSILGEE